MRNSLVLLTIIAAAGVAGCERKEPALAEPRPVRAVVVERKPQGDAVALTGQLRAKDQINLAFRLEGRMTERRVRVGDRVTAGEVVARLDPLTLQNAVSTAEAALAAAQSAKTQTSLAFARQQELLKDGWTPRARYDDAQQAQRTAQAQVDAAEAQLRIARDQLSYATVCADAPGVVTAVGAEPGEVIHGGQTIVQVAREDGLDAVFDAPESLMRADLRDPQVEIALTGDPSVKAVGRVREVAPQADPVTRTFQVKIAVADPPQAMRLGATVSGRIRLNPPPGVEVPATALTEDAGKPAVWVVDPHSGAVSRRNVEVARYDPADFIVSHGLAPGDAVVTAGVQTLRPNQKVRLLGDAQ